MSPCPLTFTGDGIADFSFWRPSSGEWFVLRSDNTGFFSFPFGAAGDVPAPGTSMVMELTMRQSSDPQAGRGSFSDRATGRRTSSHSVQTEINPSWAITMVMEVMMSLYTNRTLVSFWQLRSQQGLRAYRFGTVGDTALVADFSGDGTDDIGVFRDGSLVDT